MRPRERRNKELSRDHEGAGTILVTPHISHSRLLTRAALLRLRAELSRDHEGAGTILVTPHISHSRLLTRAALFPDGAFGQSSIAHACGASPYFLKSETRYLVSYG